MGTTEPAFGQVYDANRHALMASLNETGLCDVTDGGILPDSPQGKEQYFYLSTLLNRCCLALLDAFGGALDTYDMIITSGGVSMGEKVS